MKRIVLFLFSLFWVNLIIAQDEGCLDFNGAADYIVADNDALNAVGGGDFTFEAWINADLVGQNAHPTIFSNRPVSGVGAIFFFHNNWGGSLYKMLCVQIGGVNYFVFDNGTYDATFFDGECHHVAVTRDGSTLTFYADGVSFGTRVIGGAPSAGSVGDLWIGRDLPTSNTFNGLISQVRIWDDVRTEDEIFDNKDLSLAGDEPNLQGYWELNEGSGQIAFDKTETADGQLGTTDGADASDPDWGELCCIEGCDNLTTEVSSTDVCIGEEVTIEAFSENDGIITWDGGVENGEAFVPPPGTTTYTATSTFEGDCDVTVEITAHDLPDISALGYPTEVCLGESVILVGGGGVVYEWDHDVEDGISFIPDEVGTTTYTVTGTDEYGCVNTDEIDITVLPGPAVYFEFVINGESSEDGATGGCILNPVQFNDLTTVLDPDVIEEWDWNFGDGSGSSEENPTHTYDDPGTYTITLTVTTEAGCEVSYELIIIMTDGLSLDILLNEPTCFGYSDGSITLNVEGAGDDITFVITDSEGEVLNEDNSNTANTLTSGWYYFEVSDGSACDVIDSVFIDDPEELDIDITLAHVDCYGFETGWARVDEVFNFTGDYADISYIWNPNPSGVGGVFADSAYNMGAGEYTLTINDENGCSKVFDFEITEPDSMYFAEFGFDPAYCRMHAYQKGNGVVYGAASGGTPDFEYLWTNLDTEETFTGTTWGGLNPGNYQLVATDENGCILTRSIFVDSLNPIADFTITSDQLNEDLKGTGPIDAEFTNTSLYFANPNNPLADTTFFWSLDTPNTDWILTHDYFEQFDTTYEAKGLTYEVDVCLVALNSNGCTDTTCKTITVFEPLLFVPINVFTPNGDGINDLFTFEYRAASVAKFKCTIVNRWGNIVHEMNSINEGWDGTDRNGSICKSGTYFYVYSFQTDDGSKNQGQGTITLLLKE